ncbi:hypothetical protein ABZ716_13755 [Streptomyces sp. NPDC006687]|uniref:hypothetical protein n=1 Tax=unclassified Streptomyces TaxID=2593676 RepID=UPI0033E3E88A
MPDRWPPADALGSLEAELVSSGHALIELTARDAWLAFLRFGQRRFDTASSPDSDGLLFQYGTYSFSGPPMFTLDLTRQFDISDEDGEHDHFLQIHCELLYTPDQLLRDLSSFTSWFFHDSDDNIDRWAEAMSVRLEPLSRHKPTQINLHAERI